MTDSGITTEQEVLCLGCGYRLRGLSEDAACPECGMAGWESREGGLLSNSDPVWLSTIRWGIRLGVVSSSFYGLKYLVLTAAYSGTALASWARAFYGLMQAIEWAPVSLSIASVWLATDLPLAGRPSWIHPAFRPLARWSMLGALVLTAWIYALTYGPDQRSHVTATAYLGFAAAISAVLTNIGSLLFLRSMVRRVPDRALAHFIDVLMAYGAVLYIATGLVRLPELGVVADRASAAVASLLMCANGVASIVLSWRCNTRLTVALSGSMCRWHPATAMSPNPLCAEATVPAGSTASGSGRCAP